MSKLNHLQVHLYGPDALPLTSHSWAAVGTSHYRSLVLPKKLREIAILYCGAKFGSSYEFEHHIIVSADILTDAQRSLLKTAATDPGFFETARQKGDKLGDWEVEGLFDERERVLLRFLETTTNGPVVEEGLWGEMKRQFSEREIVEVMSLQASALNESRMGDGG